MNGRRQSPGAVEAGHRFDRQLDAGGEGVRGALRRPAATGSAVRRLGRAAFRRWTDLKAAISALLRVPSVRYSLLGLAAVAVLIAAMTQMASVIVDEWSQRDIELRARLVFRSIHERVVAGLAAKAAGADLQPFFEQLVEDERLQALGFCDPQGRMLYATKDMPDAVHCPKPPLPKVDTFTDLHDEEPPIATRPLSAFRQGGRGLAARRRTISRSSTGGRMRPNSTWRSR